VTRRRTQRQSRVWTAPRVALLRDLWPQMHLRLIDMVPLINALPGMRPIPSGRSIHAYARDHDFPRRADNARAAGLPVVHPQGQTQKARIAAMSEQDRNAWADHMRSKRTSPRTEERAALLRTLWPDLTFSDNKITARLNELPGIQINDRTTTRRYARDLGLPATRIEAAKAAGLPTTPLRNGTRRAAETQNDQPIFRTPERAALLRDLWPDLCVTENQALARINALPGRQAKCRNAIRAYAVSLGMPRLRTQAAAEAGLPTSPRPAATPKPKLAPLPRQAAPPPPPTAPRIQPAPPPAPDQPPAPTQVETALAYLRANYTHAAIMQATNISAADLAALIEHDAAQADAAREAKIATARRLLAKRTEPGIVALQAKLPLREVFTIAAQMRQARAA
jgi:hypothetical protein